MIIERAATPLEILESAVSVTLALELQMVAVDRQEIPGLLSPITLSEAVARTIKLINATQPVVLVDEKFVRRFLDGARLMYTQTYDAQHKHDRTIPVFAAD